MKWVQRPVRNAESLEPVNPLTRAESRYKQLQAHGATVEKEEKTD